MKKGEEGEAELARVMYFGFRKKQLMCCSGGEGLGVVTVARLSTYPLGHGFWWQEDCY